MFDNKEDFKSEYLNRFKETTGESFENSSIIDKYKVLASLIMKHISIYMADTNITFKMEKNEKKLYYFSMEFLVGKLLSMNLLKLGIIDLVKEGLLDLGVELSDLEDMERDAGLGNGGLGRLAACLMDSMSFLNIPAIGIGIRYRYGLFEQKIIDGNQVEIPDRWLKDGNQWEIKKNSKSEIIKFYGNIKVQEIDGKVQFIHEDYEAVTAVPYDIPMLGYETKDANYLRLWSAETVDDFDLNSFNKGNYLNAVRNKASAEAITHILYPNDSNYEGRLLRLKQQYFFASAGLKSIIKSYKLNNHTVDNIENDIQIQINDTHPSMVIPELMRIFIDEEGLDWDVSWKKISKICSYTNHTILPEALETWPQDMMRKLLPRVYMIIEEINRRFIDCFTEGNYEMILSNSILREGVVHMANLAIIGSKSINGVAKLHTDILKNETFKDLYSLYPQKFNSVTNGVSHRRFLLKSNPDLCKIISNKIGDGWKKDSMQLEKLNDYCGNDECLKGLYETKRINKQRLADYIKKKINIEVDVDSIFDVHVKRIHEYKRQLLNILHIMYLYDKIKNENMTIYPRTFIFAGKAAPGYYIAKKIIKLINSLANIINNDNSVNKYIKVIFLENFNVSLGEIIYPAADVSEQISTASKEASGTGNMKFMMNGALTLGTLDGANIEIMEKAGEDNVFIFGLKAEEVMKYYQSGEYSSFNEYNSNPALKKVINQLIDGFFVDDIGEFKEIYDSLITYNDIYFVIKDFESYKNKQIQIEKTYLDRKLWFGMVARNISASGYFSSDRTVEDYNKIIWKIKRG